MSANKVTRCICHGRTFEEVKEYARKQNYNSIEQLQNDKFCSCSCGLCIPYVEITLNSGQTEFQPGEPFRKDR